MGGGGGERPQGYTVDPPTDGHILHLSFEERLSMI